MAESDARVDRWLASEAAQRFEVEEDERYAVEEVFSEHEQPPNYRCDRCNRLMFNKGESMATSKESEDWWDPVCESCWDDLLDD